MESVPSAVHPRSAAVVDASGAIDAKKVTGGSESEAMRSVSPASGGRSEAVDGASGGTDPERSFAHREPTSIGS